MLIFNIAWKHNSTQHTATCLSSSNNTSPKVISNIYLSEDALCGAAATNRAFFSLIEAQGPVPRRKTGVYGRICPSAQIYLHVGDENARFLTASGELSRTTASPTGDGAILAFSENQDSKLQYRARHAGSPLTAA
jgi:hypothetical protein